MGINEHQYQPRVTNIRMYGLMAIKRTKTDTRQRFSEGVGEMVKSVNNKPRRRRTLSNQP